MHAHSHDCVRKEEKSPLGPKRSFSLFEREAEAKVPNEVSRAKQQRSPNGLSTSRAAYARPCSTRVEKARPVAVRSEETLGHLAATVCPLHAAHQADERPRLAPPACVRLRVRSRLSAHLVFFPRLASPRSPQSALCQSSLRPMCRSELLAPSSMPTPTHHDSFGAEAELRAHHQVSLELCRHQR